MCSVYGGDGEHAAYVCGAFFKLTMLVILQLQCQQQNIHIFDFEKIFMNNDYIFVFYILVNVKFFRTHCIINGEKVQEHEKIC